MPSLFNVLICIIAVLLGFAIGKAYRAHKVKKDPKNPKYTKDGKINMSQYKNLTAVHDKFTQHEKDKAKQKNGKNHH